MSENMFQIRKGYKKFCIRKKFSSRKNNTKNLVSEKIFQLKKTVLEVWCRRKFSQSEKL